MRALSPQWSGYEHCVDFPPSTGLLTACVLVGSSASSQPPVDPTVNCWWVSPQAALHPVVMRLAPPRPVLQQLALRQRVAPRVARLPERLVELEVVHAIGEAQRRLPERLLVMYELPLHILHDVQHMGSAPPLALVLDRLRKAPRLHHLEGHDRCSSGHGGPSTTRGSSGRAEGAIWLHCAGNAPGRSGTG